MKTIFLATLIALTSTLSFGQITLEHTYGSASNPAWIFATKLSTGYKYCWVSKATNTLKIYNLDHSLFKEITFNPPSNNYYVDFVSDKLFDMNNKIEFMISSEYDNYTQIINEDGTIISNLQGQVPFSTTSDFGPGPIINTADGTKMLLATSDQANDQISYVYSLPGSLPTALLTPNENKYNINLYPNPASDFIKINYSLPANVKIAKVDVFDMNGKIVKTYKVDKTFNDILIDTNDLSSGTYICKISSNKQEISETKFVITK